jgi:hypothetical protein
VTGMIDISAKFGLEQGMPAPCQALHVHSGQRRHLTRLRLDKDTSALPWLGPWPDAVVCF